MVLATFLVLAHASVDADQVFATIDGTELKCDVYRPTTTSNSRAIAVFYGGAWMAGNKKDVAPVCEQLAAQGFTAVAFQYRLAPKFHFPVMIEDARTGVRWLRSKARDFKIDPRKIGAVGFSAGAHLSLMLGTTDVKKAEPYSQFSSKVQAVGDFFGPTDLSNAADYPKYLDNTFAIVLGKKREQATEEIRAASPLNFVDKTTAPIFIYQGLADPLVNPHQSRALEAKLKENNVPVESVYLEGVAHEVPVQKPGVIDAVNKAFAFLKAHLK